MALILWVAIVASAIFSIAWSYVGRTSPWFVAVEVACGAVSGLLWGLLAKSAGTQALFVYTIVWDVIYCLVLVLVPTIWFRIELPIATWVFLGLGCVFFIAAKVSMGVSP